MVKNFTKRNVAIHGLEKSCALKNCMQRVIYIIYNHEARKGIYKTINFFMWKNSAIIKKNGKTCVVSFSKHKIEVEIHQYRDKTMPYIHIYIVKGSRSFSMCFTPPVIVIIHDVAYYEADLRDFISSEQSINKSQDLL